MRLKPLMISVLAAFLLFGCAAKISKSIVLHDIQSTDFKKSLSEMSSENFWVQCFNVSENDIIEKMAFIMKQCFEEELRSAPDFMTNSEVEAVNTSAIFCTQSKMWSIYKDKFTLDKNFNDKKIFSFCVENWDIYKYHK